MLTNRLAKSFLKRGNSDEEYRPPPMAIVAALVVLLIAILEKCPG
jgi:hypothetical protein